MVQNTIADVDLDNAALSEVEEAYIEVCSDKDGVTFWARDIMVLLLSENTIFI